MVYNVTVIATDKNDATSWLGTEYIEPDELTELDLLDCIKEKCEDLESDDPKEIISDFKKCRFYQDGKCTCMGWKYNLYYKNTIIKKEDE